MEKMDLIRFYSLVLSIWIGFLVTGMNGSRDMDVNLVLSTPIKEGDDLKMKCLFSPPLNTSVSSVKWYKGNREIFRYEHRPMPRKQVFPIGNITVDDGNSDMQTLKLRNVPAFMTGDISCEVTLEDPSAKVVTKRTKLLVVVPPKEKPQLDANLIKFNFQNKLHQKLLANCTSAPSKPATNLTFHLNDIPILHDAQGISLRASHPETTTILDFNTVNANLNSNSLEVRRIELEVHLQDQFVNGQVKLKCVSELYNVYNSTSNEFVGEQIRPKQVQNSLYSLYGKGRGGAAGTLNPSSTILESTVGKLVLITIILGLC